MKIIKIKVIPHASKDEVAGKVGDALKVRVRAPAEDGRANQAVIQLLAKHFNVHPNQIKIHSGQLSPRKIIQIEE
ncbi:MAG: YggU family protein [Verrucomicrobia bacterium GWC2_42_7]|nr:MAG: YggU family protein [Verrucomicrobia bacterium GWC2_42_7]